MNTDPNLPLTFRLGLPSLDDDAPSGASLRDYFAAHAMHEFMAMAPRVIDQAQAQVIAEDCYIMADAMLEARKRASSSLALQRGE